MTAVARVSERHDRRPLDKVLIVDCDKAVTHLLAIKIKRRYQLEVDTVSTLHAAEVRLMDFPNTYCVAVVNTQLPDLSGGEVVDRIVAHKVPVIVLSADHASELREKMMNRFVVDYIIKRQIEDVERTVNLVQRVHKNQSTKVLVVDESYSFRFYMTQLLEKHRYQVLEAEDVQRAMGVLRRNSDIALVLVDNKIPHCGAAHFIEELRREFDREQLAVIATSDSRDPHLASKLMKVGANDYIWKPFEAEEFYCRVTQHVELVEKITEIREHATRDYLTKCFNRRYLFDIGETLHSNARRGNISLAAAMIDADHFKRINDTYGHDVGDLAIKHVASILESTLRNTDVVARFGGEEFVCLATGLGTRDAITVFERVRQTIEGTPLEFDNQTLQMTVSIGVTMEPRGSLDEMINAADKGVYRAKENGRNQVFVV